MKLIGYWIESLRDADYYAPQEFVGDWPARLRTQVAEYLDSGQVFRVYRGYSWCRFRCGRDFQSMGARELTDGYWVWPEGLSHYVRDHSVTLPAEFVRHVESSPASIPKEQWDMSPPDTDFWKAWCRENASEEYRSRLAAARQRADCEAERLFADAVAKLKATSGESEAICRWAGCGNRALAGKAFCAHCMLKGQKDMIVSEVYHDLRSVLQLCKTP